MLNPLPPYTSRISATTKAWAAPPTPPESDVSSERTLACDDTDVLQLAPVLLQRQHVVAREPWTLWSTVKTWTSAWLSLLFACLTGE